MEDNRAFAEKFDFPFDLLSDEDRAVGLEYGACESSDDLSAKRIAYLVDRNGLIARTYAMVVPAEHAERVLEDLRALED